RRIDAARLLSRLECLVQCEENARERLHRSRAFAARPSLGPCAAHREGPCPPRKAQCDARTPYRLPWPGRAVDRGIDTSAQDAPPSRALLDPGRRAWRAQSGVHLRRLNRIRTLCDYGRSHMDRPFSFAADSEPLE